jgi:hypothetical protein
MPSNDGKQTEDQSTVSCPSTRSLHLGVCVPPLYVVVDYDDDYGGKVLGYN